MNKIFISVLSLVLVCLASESRSDWGEEARIQINEAASNTRNAAVRLKDNTVRTVKSWVERDNENYWLNNLRSYKTYPINFYNGDGWKYDGNKEREEIATREYKHNVVVSANVGQRMLDSETYTITVHNNSPRYVPTTDVSFYGLSGDLHLKAGQELEPLGEVKIEGIYYLLFDPNKNGQVVMIDETGRFLHMICHIYKRELIVSKKPTAIRPKDARADRVSGVKHTTEAPKFHFELKYEGLEDKKMSFLYISSETGGLAQRFTYPETQKVINIYGNKIQIIRPYADRIEYMILD